MNKLQTAGICLFAPLLFAMPAQAESRWIKATITGTVIDFANSAPSNTIFYQSDEATGIQNFTWNFVIQDYLGTNDSASAEWGQSTAEYFPIFGYGTLTESTGMYGTNWYKYSTPDVNGNFVTFSKSSGLSNAFSLRVSAAGDANNYSGYEIYVSPDQDGNGIIQTSLLAVEFFGGPLVVANSNPQQLLDVANTNTNVTSFIQAALAATPGNDGDYTCSGTCTGDVFFAEGQFSFTWDTVSFSEVVPTPSPLPVLGAGTCFAWARSIRRRRVLAENKANSKSKLFT